MTFTFWKLKPVEWFQGIRSSLGTDVAGRYLSAACKADDSDLVLSNREIISPRLIQIAFLQGEPTEGDGQPLEGGIERLFHTGGAKGQFTVGTF